MKFMLMVPFLRASYNFQKFLLMKKDLEKWLISKKVKFIQAGIY